ncbi:MAG: hypothetical protein KAJ90_02045 [Desulfobacterales bacterium]|nr:hypothetical protein [Desulfobacterales bacterium]
MNTATGLHTPIPLSTILADDVFPNAFLQQLRTWITQLDELTFVDAVFNSSGNEHRFALRLMHLPLTFAPFGTNSFALQLDQTTPPIVHGCVQGRAVDLNLTCGLKLQIPPEILRPALSTSGETTELVELSFLLKLRVKWALGLQPDIEIDVPKGVSLSPACIGTSGFVVSADNILLSLIPNKPLPQVVDAGFGTDFVGLYIGHAEVRLPDWLAIPAPPTITFSRTIIGTTGFSGTAQANFNLSFIPASGTTPAHFTGQAAGTFLGIPMGLDSLGLAITKNRFSSSTLTGQILLPFMDEPTTLTGGLSNEGKTIVAGLDHPSGFSIDVLDASIKVGSLKANCTINTVGGFAISGELSQIHIELGSMLNTKVAIGNFDLAIQKGAWLLSVGMEQFGFGPLGTIANADFRIQEDVEGTKTISASARAAWDDLSDRLDIPDFVPVPPAGSAVDVSLQWNSSSTGESSLTLQLLAEAGQLDLNFLSGIPETIRPEVRNARLAFEVTYNSEDEFRNAGTSGKLGGAFSTSVELRIPQLEKINALDSIEVRTGDSEGWIGANFNAVLDENGQASIMVSVTNPVGLSINLPILSQEQAPVILSLTSASFAIKTGTSGETPSSVEGAIGFGGTFQLRPIVPPDEWPISEHLTRLLEPIAVTELTGEVTAELKFKNDNLLFDVICEFEDAAMDVDVFDLIANLARGISSPEDEANVSRATAALDLDVGFGLRRLAFKFGDLEGMSQESHIEIKLGICFLFGGLIADGHISLSDQNLSIGLTETLIPLQMPRFPLKPDALDDLNTELKWNTKIDGLRSKIETMEGNTRPWCSERSLSDRVTPDLVRLQELKSMLAVLLIIWETRPKEENALSGYLANVKMILEFLEAYNGLTCSGSQVKLKLSNVQFVIPFSDPRNLAIEGGASLIGFADDDPFNKLEEIEMVIGLSADMIYFSLDYEGDPITVEDFERYLPALNRYRDGSINLSKLSIGYGYTKNSLAVAFMGEMIFPEQLIADADTSHSLGVGVKLPRYNRLAFRFDLIPIPPPSPIPVVPLLDFNLDLRRPGAQAIASTQTCKPAYDGLEFIFPDVVHTAFKKLAVSPFFSILPCPNIFFDGDLVLGNKNTGLTIIADDMHFLLGLGSGLVPIPYLASPSEPYFNHLCINVRLAGFGLNVNLERPLPNLNPLAFLEVAALIADPTTPIDPEGTLANTLRIALTDAYITIPDYALQIFPEAAAVNHKDLNIVLNLGTVITGTQWVIEVIKETLATIDSAGQDIEKGINSLASNPQNLNPAALLKTLPPELRKMRFGASFAGFEGNAAVLLITPEDAIAEMKRRDGPQTPSRSPENRIGSESNPDEMLTWQPNLFIPAGQRPSYPNDPQNNLFRGIEFEAFSATDIESIPTQGRSLSGIMVGAYLKVFGGQRYRFLGSLYEDGSFSIISALDIQPLKLKIAGISVKLPLEFSGRLEMSGRQKRNGYYGEIKASVFGRWKILEKVAVIEIASKYKPAGINIFSDGTFAIKGAGRVVLFNGTAEINGEVDISHTHCFVDGRLSYSAPGIIDLSLDGSARFGPGPGFALSGEAKLSILGHEFTNVSGVVSESGVALRARLDTGQWMIQDQMIDCRLKFDLNGELSLTKSRLPEFNLEGKGFLNVFGAEIKGRCYIRGGKQGHKYKYKTAIGVEGALTWQGHRWLEGRIEIGTNGVVISGKTSFTLAAPSRIGTTQFVAPVIQIDLEGSFHLDKTGALSFSANGLTMLAIQFPDISQRFPIAVDQFEIRYGTALTRRRLLSVRGISPLPSPSFTIPAPDIRIEKDKLFTIDVPKLKWYPGSVVPLKLPSLTLTPITRDIYSYKIAGSGDWTTTTVNLFEVIPNFDVFLVWSNEDRQFEIEIETRK